MALVDLTQSIRIGAIGELKDTWKRNMPSFQKQYSKILRKLKPNTARNAIYPFKESLPYLNKWSYKTERLFKSLRDRVINMGKIPYNLSIMWSKWDALDDQLDMEEVKTHAQSCTKRYLRLPFDLYTEYCNGTASLNDSILNAYDGASLYSTTDGSGAARFGATGGNILNGSGRTVAGFMHDLMVAQQRFFGFLDPTAGLEIFDDTSADVSKFFIVGPKTYNEIFTKASEQEFIRSDPTSYTSESNFLKGKFEFAINPQLSDDEDWYIFLEHELWKAFVFRGDEEVESFTMDLGNSDHAKLMYEEGFLTNMRCYLAPFMPACTIKINNG